MKDLLPLMIMDSLTSGLLAVDLDSRVLCVNAALAKQLGINREEWLGKSAASLFHTVEPQAPSRRSPLYRFDPRRDPARTYSREVEWSDGKRIVYLREDSAPLYDPTGALAGRLFAYHDLSWEKTIDQMKSEFISIASHELRTPMTAIKGSVDLILGGCVGEIGGEVRELLEVAQTGCDRMIRLVNDFLDLSKIEAGQIKLNLAPLDLTNPVQRSLQSLKSLAAQDQITLRLEGPANLPLVKGDRDRLEQVITNLISNAIKYSPAEAEVRISLSAEAGWVSCTVHDQGCGIEDKDLDRIFGKFQQVGSPQRGGGTGLGLAISHALVTEHKGKIWVESGVGVGSRFVFSLPEVGPKPTS
jgi:PAS domain S-box-containing protein